MRKSTDEKEKPINMKLQKQNNKTSGASINENI